MLDCALLMNNGSLMALLIVAFVVASQPSNAFHVYDVAVSLSVFWPASPALQTASAGCGIFS